MLRNNHIRANLDSGRVCDTMASRTERIIRQSPQRVANVKDNFGLISSLDVMKGAQLLLVLNLQSAC